MNQRSPWQAAKIAGIPIVVHPTFLLLLAWVVLTSLASHRGVVRELVLVASLFVCVVLHELSHALTAQHFGIRTRSITLLPIGGVAQLERLPDRPRQELLVALAGPAMSFGIAAALWALQRALSLPLGLEGLGRVGAPFLAQLMWINVGLAAFNLLPAFPMDGGRVFRALLALRFDRERATRIAARVGQSMALLFGLVGLLFNPMLVLIAVFVWVGAKGEALMQEQKQALSAMTVERAMIREFHVLDPTMPLSAAVELAFLGWQQDFPVTYGNQPLGVLTRTNIVRALAAGQSRSQVGEWMERSFALAEPSEPLDVAVERLRSGDSHVLLIMQQGRLVGLLTPEHVAEVLAFGSELRPHRAQRRLLQLGA